MTSRMFPLVTIAIPTFNRAGSYLRSALRCATGQTYRNVEVIVSDNCSADDTEAVVGSFDDPRIRYFRQEKNIGANNNFNFCLAQAKGEYFLLLQDDDLIDGDFIETCMKEVDPQKDVGIIRSGTRIIDSAENLLGERQNLVRGLSTEDFFLGWFSGKTVLYLCSTLFNTKLLKEIGGFGSKHNLFQDVVAEVALASRFGRVDIQDVKASFRKHDGEMTFAARVGNWCEDSLILLDQMCEAASEEKRRQIRREGMRFFSRINYSRAASVRSLSGRCGAYYAVWRKFGFRYFPSVKSLFSRVYNRLRGTPIHSAARAIRTGLHQILGGNG